MVTFVGHTCRIITGDFFVPHHTVSTRHVHTPHFKPTSSVSDPGRSVHMANYGDLLEISVLIWPTPCSTQW